MTIEELKNYRKLGYSIRYWMKELETLKKTSYTKSPQMTGMPGSGELSDPTADRALRENKIAERIERMLREQQRECDEILAWIQTIEDPMIQTIMHARYIRGKSWTAVAHAVGGYNTPDSVRKIHTRYLSVLSGNFVENSTMDEVH